jgi:hypothetical protein
MQVRCFLFGKRKHYIFKYFVRLPRPLSHVAAFHHSSIFTFTPLLSEGRAGEAWEPYKTVMLFLPLVLLSCTILLCVSSARNAFFYDITQPVVVIPYRCLGKTYTVKDGTQRLSRNVVRNCHHSLCNDPEECTDTSSSARRYQCTRPSGNSEPNIWCSNYDVYGEGTQQLAQLQPAASGELLSAFVPFSRRTVTSIGDTNHPGDSKNQTQEKKLLEHAMKA